MSTSDATDTVAGTVATIPSDAAAPDGTGRTRPVTATGLACADEELGRIEAVQAAGTLRVQGGWTPRQVLRHVGRFCGSRWMASRSGRRSRCGCSGGWPSDPCCRASRSRAA